MNLGSMSRYLIIGYSGSGKSTLARKISTPYFDTDELYWSDEWRLLSDFEVWSRATSIVWVNPPAFLVMFRLIKRNLVCWASRKPSWGGSRMSFNVAMSGIIHGWKKLFYSRSNFPGFLNENLGKSIHRIRSRSEHRLFLKSIQPK